MDAANTLPEARSPNHEFSSPSLKCIFFYRKPCVVYRIVYSRLCMRLLFIVFHRINSSKLFNIRGYNFFLFSTARKMQYSTVNFYQILMQSSTSLLNNNVVRMPWPSFSQITQYSSAKALPNNIVFITTIASFVADTCLCKLTYEQTVSVYRRRTNEVGYCNLNQQVVTSLLKHAWNCSRNTPDQTNIR